MFNFLGRDFFTALSNKDVDKFTEMLIKWLAALCAGIPVFVFRDYYQASSRSCQSLTCQKLYASYLGCC